MTQAQAFVSTAELFRRPDSPGELKITQAPAVDTLISRYLLMSKKLYDESGHYGMNGYRIQICNSSSKEESKKVNADFIIKFPDIESYQLFSEPRWWKVRIGDFRTKAEAMKTFIAISREFPDAYIVPDIINFPDLEKK
jgi:hypothetical protein